MELSAVDTQTEIEPYKTLESEPEIWQRIGDAAFSIFSLSALGAALPALTPKKKTRIYTSGTPNQPVQQTDIVEEPTSTQPIPQKTTEQPKRAIQKPVPLCKDEEAAKVKDIFDTTAKGSWWDLISGGWRLVEEGNELRKALVHPLSFLQAATKQSARDIFSGKGRVADFKIGKVMEGIVEGMEREWPKDNLLCYVDSFEEVFTKEWEQILSPNKPIPIDHEKIRGSIEHLIKACDWRKLTDYLFLDIPEFMLKIASHPQ